MFSDYKIQKIKASGRNPNNLKAIKCKSSVSYFYFISKEKIVSFEIDFLKWIKSFPNFLWAVQEFPFKLFYHLRMYRCICKQHPINNKNIKRVSKKVMEKIMSIFLRSDFVQNWIRFVWFTMCGIKISVD